MCSSLSTSRLILLISLSVMMLISVSGADLMGNACYENHSNQNARTTFAPKWAKTIISCVEDNRHGCLHGYEVKTRAGRAFFLRPNTEWLKRKINEGALLCPPMFSKWWWWKRWSKSCRKQDPSILCSFINSFFLLFSSSFLFSSSSFTNSSSLFLHHRELCCVLQCLQINM